MSELIHILILLAFIGGVVGLAALWTQRDMNRQREQDAAAKKAADDHPV